MKRTAVYAETYGLVFRFSPRKWRQMLRVLASGQEVRYNDYGRIVCDVSRNITDLDQEQAASLLAEYEKKEEP